MKSPQNGGVEVPDALRETEMKFQLTVVRIGAGIRCVYVNDYRLVGSKPYISEGGEYKNYDFTINELRKAFPELEIKEKRHDHS